MRRRRLFRPRRLTGRRGVRGLEAEPLRLLARANHLLEVGQHTNAAVLFERLAREGLDRDFAHQAPFLWLQAGRARLLSGDPQAGVEHLREGLSWLARQGRWRALRRAGPRVVDDLLRLDQPGASQELIAWLETLLQGHEPLPGDSPTPASLPRLPVQCPHCGAPVRSNEVDWLDKATAECVYCGGAIPSNG
jgi:hypothetical protein